VSPHRTAGAERWGRWGRGLSAVSAGAVVGAAMARALEFTEGYQEVPGRGIEHLTVGDVGVEGGGAADDDQYRGLSARHDDAIWLTNINHLGPGRDGWTISGWEVVA
jgi:hypothetical protein